MNAREHRWREKTVLLCCGLLWLQTAAADPPSDHAGHEQPGKELVLFLSSEASHISSSAPASALNEDASLSADIVLALTRDRFRLFGEYLLTTEEHDLERFQIGYEPAANTVIWLGRFHQPASAWNTEHHHGRYLQTSITRPSIELWEDEGGIVAQHVSGVLVDSRVPVGEMSGLHLEVGTGLGPRVKEGELDPLDLLNPHESGRHLSWTGRIAFLPDFLGASSFGLVAAHHRMPVVDASIVNFPFANEVRQGILGVFGEWHSEPWRVVGAVYDVRLRLVGPATSVSERFTAGYLEGARQLPHALLAFARVEDTAHATRSGYLSGNYPDFELRRFIGGLRWDFGTRQALTLELGRGETVRARQSEFRLQWSAALP